MLAAVNNFLKYVDDLVWGVPLIINVSSSKQFFEVR